MVLSLSDLISTCLRSSSPSSLMSTSMGEAKKKAAMNGDGDDDEGRHFGAASASRAVTESVSPKNSAPVAYNDHCNPRRRRLRCSRRRQVGVSRCVRARACVFRCLGVDSYRTAFSCKIATRAVFGYYRRTPCS